MLYKKAKAKATWNCRHGGQDYLSDTSIGTDGKSIFWMHDQSSHDSHIHVSSMIYNLRQPFQLQIQIQRKKCLKDVSADSVGIQIHDSSNGQGIHVRSEDKDRHGMMRDESMR